MKNNVVLFNPMPVKHLELLSTTSQQVPLVNVPLSLLALARMLRDDFNVKIFNAVVDSDYEKEILEACRDALCFAVSSMTCYQIRDGINICEAVKKKYPSLPIIWGGYHPSTAPLQTLENPYIDIVVRGQGELTLKEVVERLRDNVSLEGVKGVSYKEGNRIVTNPDRDFADINEFPTLQYDIINVERHIKGYKFGKRCIDHYTSQGCTSACGFCSEPLFCKRRWSGLKAEVVVSELEHLAITYNIDTFMIRDSDFFLDIKRVKEICRLLVEKDLGIRLTSVNGRMQQFSRLNDSLLALLRRAGICEVFIGFESGMQEALDVMNKGAKAGQIKACTDKCVKHDIDLRGSFMLGIPGVDSKGEIKSTFKGIHEIICAYGKRGRLEHLDILLSFFTPYPNTPLYETSLKCGLKPLNTLEEWGDFDQFDFKAPWLKKEYFELVKEFRAGMPWNSGYGFEGWCNFYNAIAERLENLF